MSAGQDVVFNFRIPPGGRQVIWRDTGTHDCLVSISLRGRGRLAFALRGY